MTLTTPILSVTNLLTVEAAWTMPRAFTEARIVSATSQASSASVLAK
jgi:hypothetical protein